MHTSRNQKGNYNMGKKFRALRPDEVELRVQSCTEKGYSLLLYKDARCDNRILDETVSAENWTNSYRTVKDVLYCTISIWDEKKQQWISKENCGTESNTEAVKGEASDAFKRAAFNWGLGRELYSAPFIWVNGGTQKNNKGSWVPVQRTTDLKVTVMEVEDEKITKLVINDKNGVVFSHPYGAAKKTPAKKPDGETVESVIEKIKTVFEKVKDNKAEKDRLYQIVSENFGQKNFTKITDINMAKKVLADLQFKE